MLKRVQHDTKSVTFIFCHPGLDSGPRLRVTLVNVGQATVPAPGVLVI